MNQEEVTLLTQDGRTVYWPKGDLSRLAPAAVCSMATRIIRLREFLKKHPEIPHELKRQLEMAAAPFQFEEEFMSNDVYKVHMGIFQLGRKWLKLPTAVITWISKRL